MTEICGDPKTKAWDPSQLLPSKKLHIIETNELYGTVFDKKELFSIFLNFFFRQVPRKDAKTKLYQRRKRNAA